MKLTAIVLIAGLALAAPAFAKDAGENRRIEMAGEILQITQIDKIFKQVSDSAITSQRQALEIVLKDADYTDAERQQIIGEISQVVLEELEPAFKQMGEKLAPLYADIFTEEELAGILAFYKSDAGKAMLAKQDVLMQRSSAIGEQWNEENLQAAMARMTPRIQKIMTRVKAKN